MKRGIDPKNFNVEAATFDTLDLLVALKIPTVDLIVRESLGTVAYGMLRRAPGSIRSLTIEDPFPGDRTSLSGEVSNLAGAFQRYVAQCTASVICRTGYPDLAERYRAGHAAHAAAPTLVAADNPDVGKPPVSVLLDGPRSAQALSQALRSPDTYSLIPAAIAQTADAAIAAQAVKFDQADIESDFTWGADLSYVCSYDLRTFDPNGTALSAQTAPAFDVSDVARRTSWCTAWNVPAVPDQVFATPASPVPALLFRGDLSPTADPGWIHTVARGFPNSSTLVFPTLGGQMATSAPPCLADLRRKFLAHPTTKLKPSEIAACVALSPPIQWVTPAG